MNKTLPAAFIAEYGEPKDWHKNRKVLDLSFESEDEEYVTPPPPPSKKAKSKKTPGHSAFYAAQLKIVGAASSPGARASHGVSIGASHGVSNVVTVADAIANASYADDGTPVIQLLPNATEPILTAAIATPTVAITGAPAKASANVAANTKIAKQTKGNTTKK
ncbi:hypothetical protein CYMTET_16337 [Cymbomonas tetramitiformis]|uniref:Uncharacterized protein n=1 Tax=Cymbomonas tetramitiformis TaxID=36881 RepID=A0AAE0L8C9_9CHLO|nr:hypothetical protein CYMTET_16337 [Cymbomonas tetramitiformis]